MHNRYFLAAFAALLVSTGARANESGFYLGAAVGEASQTGQGFKGSDTSFEWLAGYSFNKYLAAEAGFVDAGTQRDTVDSVDLKVASDGTFAALLVKLPLGRIVAPYARVGYVFYDSTTTASSGAARASEFFSDEDLLYGAGLEFRVSGRFRLRAEYERVDVPDVRFGIYSFVATFQF